MKCAKSGVTAKDLAGLDTTFKDLPKTCDAALLACQVLDVKATKLVASLASDVRACDP
ncbi:MAG: hypothetical protein PHW63_10250 [Alphaproteobacteria bacterium]|nr:hypothetical protein [Alphaproteobacteria bacterium]